jgi:HEAT repeats/PBS lyase HEAT-like repeat
MPQGIRTRRETGLGSGACLLLLLTGPAGCLDSTTKNQIAARDSILAPLFEQTTVKDAAAWASDPFDADKRARGTLLLANAPFGGAEPYVKLYREHVKDESPNVQAVAARGLALHGSPEDVPALVTLSKSPSPLVRLEAVRSLQRLHNPVGVPGLIERLNPDKEPEADIRAEAASGLGQYAEPRVLQALIASLSDSSLLVNTNAQASLRTLTGQDQLPSDRKAWATWVKSTASPFADRRQYVYPVFWREKRWLDYVPFMPTVPNEIAASPVGFPDLNSAGTASGTP